jgi:hypothetical protein
VLPLVCGRGGEIAGDGRAALLLVRPAERIGRGVGDGAELELVALGDERAEAARPGRPNPGGDGQVAGQAQRRRVGDADVVVDAVEGDAAALAAGAGSRPAGAVLERAVEPVAGAVGGGRAAALVEGPVADEAGRRRRSTCRVDRGGGKQDCGECGCSTWADRWPPDWAVRSLSWCLDVTSRPGP